MLTGLLVACVPYWYISVTGISLHIVGYTVYGVATQGWHLIVSQILAGYYVGSQLTFTYAYADDSSVAYVELIKEKEGKIGKDYRVQLRDSLYLLTSVGFVLGYFVGPGKTKHCIEACKVSNKNLHVDHVIVLWLHQSSRASSSLLLDEPI